MKGVIVYKGKYGATKKYAEWLRDELSLPIFSADVAPDIESYDYLLMGASVYIGKLQLTNWIKDNAEVLSKKLLFLFVVCGTPSDEIEKLKSYVYGSLPGEIANRCRIYFLHGRLNYKELSFKDKFLLKMGAALAKDKVVKKQMLTDYDDVKKENLADLIRDVQKIAQPFAENERVGQKSL